MTWLRAVLLAAAAVLALAACTATTATAPPSPPPSPVSPAATAPPLLHQVHDPGQVTGTILGPCHAFGGGQLPDPACTPGAYDPQVTAAQLCAPGHTTASYRPPSSQTTTFKHQVADPAYGMPAGAPGELDHLVPLELGGANDAANLWVEAGPIPNPKDNVENKLRRWVCAAPAGEDDTRLAEAQQAIAANWMTALDVLHVT